MKPQDLQTLARAALDAAYKQYEQEQMNAMQWKPTAAAALAAKVDELGALRSAIADLTTKADTIRTEIEEAGLTNIDGQHYSATLTSVKGSTRIDWQAIAAKFKPSRQLIAAHTTTGKAATRMSVKARQTH